jgi:succinate-semialdehyde dehydrogenase / glutarate-semialdehyde dehydrogenase
MFKGINPFTQEVLYEIALDKDTEIQAKIETAHQAYLQLKHFSYKQKADCLLQLADYLTQHKHNFALRITQQMGKILAEANIEIEKSIKTCYWYAEHGATMLQETLVHTEARLAKYVFESSGVLLAVMPWNFPIWQPLRFIIPQILAGNPVLLKPAPNVAWSGADIYEALAHTNLPKGFFNNLIVTPEQLPTIVAHQHVTGVTLTGSVQAGKSLASLAGQHIKKSVLELGGSDPFIVLADAQIKDAAQMAVKARFQNAGQTCIAAKRWIIHKDIAEEFIAHTQQLVAQIKFGNPLDENIQMGPLARIDLAQQLQQQLQQLTQLGGRIIFGGDFNNCLVAPTMVLIPNNINFTKELFGPIATINVVDNNNEAIAIANQTPYGLGASIWTSNELYAMQLATQIQSGNVYINEMVKSHAALPFGGIKQSGYGKELGKYGIQEFMNIKSIWIK